MSASGVKDAEHLPLFMALALIRPGFASIFTKIFQVSIIIINVFCVLKHRYGPPLANVSASLQPVKRLQDHMFTLSPLSRCKVAALVKPRSLDRPLRGIGKCRRDALAYTVPRIGH